MSMSRGCLIIERHPGQWYCVVAIDEYDYDFRDYLVYGPAATEDDAWGAMMGPNPGESVSIPHDEMTEGQRLLVDSKPAVKPGRAW